MTRLNQLIAIRDGVKKTAETAFTAAHRETQRPEPLAGISRTYQPRAEDGVVYPPELKLPQVRIGDAIGVVTQYLTRLFDVTATLDEANRNAVADVIVDGRILLPSVSVTTLLFLERKLVDLHTFIAKLPVLDPAERWRYNPDVGAFQSELSQTIKTKKIPRNHVKADATPQHPAQVEIFMEDVAEGTWSTVKYSGALPADSVAALLARVQKLTEAVKVAREAANSIEVEDVHIGAPFFDYLFGGQLGAP